MNEAKKTKAAKTPKLKPKAFGAGKFSAGEGWVHLADIMARGAKASPVVVKWWKGMNEAKISTSGHQPDTVLSLSRRSGALP